MCSLAFFAFLRIGEITATSNNQPLQLSQLSKMSNEDGRVAGIRLTFENFKHHYNGRPFSLEIYRQTAGCPVELLEDYMVLCGIQPRSREWVLRCTNLHNGALEIQCILEIYTFFYPIDVK